MKMPWLKDLMGAKITVRFGGTCFVGVLESVIYKPTPALLLSELDGAACDALINFATVDEITPVGAPRSPAYGHQFRSVPKWLESVAGLSVTIENAARVWHGRLVLANDDGPLVICIREDPQAPPHFLNWAQMRMISIHKQKAASGQGGHKEAAPDRNDDQDEGDAGAGKTAPLQPHPTGSLSVKKEIEV